MQCDTPYIVKPNGYVNHLPLPCGRCPVCKKKRVDKWVFRLKQEEKVSTSAHFITLTYDTRNVPITKHGFMTLDKTDFQKFIKRLRKKDQAGKTIKYYAAGEYGEERERPHYHAIIFNIRELENINTSWNLGDVHTGRVSSSSIAYTAKYIDKGKKIPKHDRDDRIPEFSLMSKGLGKNYLTQNVLKYHKSDLSRNYVTDERGIKIGLPRYYRDKILSEKQKVLQRKIIVKQLAKQRLEKEQQLPSGVNIDDHEFEEKLQRQTNFNKNRKIRK